MSCIGDIRDAIEANYNGGEAFAACDFRSFGGYAAVRQALSRLARKGLIRRIMRGIYDKPRFSRILQKPGAFSVHQVAFALARKNGWKLSLEGNSALNVLRLSTQVPGICVYVTSGPFKKYVFGQRVLRLWHRPPEQMGYLSEKLLWVIQALRRLGDYFVREWHVRKLQEALTPEEKREYREKPLVSPKWLCKIMNKVCKE